MAILQRPGSKMAWGAIVGGALQAAGSAYSAFSSQKEASKNRKFSRRSHRYEVADLRAAGLNPILSAGGSGASTPSSMGVIPNIGEAAVSGAEKGVKTSLQKDLINSEIGLNTAAAAKARQEGRIAAANARIQETEADIATSGWGRAMNYVGKTTGALGGAVAGALTGLISGRYSAGRSVSTHSAKGQEKLNSSKKKMLTIPIYPRR